MAEEGILGALGRIASTFVSGSPNAHQFVWSSIAPWIQELTRSATTLWLPNLVHGIPCEVVSRHRPTGVGVPCRGSAINGCSVCHLPCCLDHSFVSKSGDAICYPCAKVASDQGPPKPSPGPRRPSRGSKQSRPEEPSANAPPPPPAPGVDPQLLAQARRLLGVSRNSTPDEVRSAYRKLAARWHPDRNPHDVATATRNFQDVQRAYDLIVLSQKEAPT